ncbi:heavy metal efflux pump, CzcA family [Leptospira inadai serovar Lyme str. 10]|uniref:Heavy metal efflux pump, CzcA family n=2 Tax=Leptospira inadai serovar Lyme TaxID=293084 RepID=V6HCK6_9LEPT|nr:CusA/CzcA family heavy metal efflux RND transporter [Leptospira inadai]EQA37372.1 heavy metal efflux pump, CzcA family [Leptospira inadai serovar Lyme str. 10]PNV73022.1 CusA/CzcA family heavy metal efflux RND transporter [Leptospira inadai serovar Lyme]
MIEKLIRFSIKNRILILVLTGIVTAIGLFNAYQLSIDAIPDITNVQVSVVTQSPGLSPIEVEQFITYPIEMELTGVPNVTEIRSISRTGVSSVTAIFKDGTDIYLARQLINERLRAVESVIPKGYGSPELSPIATGLGDIYEFVLTSDRHTPEELRTYMDWELAREIKSVEGIIDVNIIGGNAKQYQIKIDPHRLAVHNITLSQLCEKLESANQNTGGGYISKGAEQIVIRGESQFKTVEEIRNVAVKTERDGVPLLLGQIAEVETGRALRFGLITKDGKGEVVGATAMMLMGQNSLEVVKRVKERIEQLKTRLPAGMQIITFYDRSEFIGRTLGTIFTNLAEAGILVIFILILAMGTVKGALLVSLAIPIPMLVATIFMRMFGIVGNLMSLGALDFGLLVDGAIVMLESILHGFIFRKAFYELQNTQEDQDLAAEQIITEACVRVARAATFSVAIILLVYLPLMTLEGVEGRMFQPMAMTVAISLAVALVFTLTTFPAAASIIFREPVFHHSKYWDKITGKYLELLDFGMKNKSLFLRAGVGIFALSLLLGSTLGSEFLPRIDEGEFAIDIKRLPSTSLNYSRETNTELEKVIGKFPEVVSVVSRMGRGESAAEPVGTEEGEAMVKLRPVKEWTDASSREELMDKMKDAILDSVPSTTIALSQPIENRVNALLSGSKADVVVKIYGDDLQVLKDTAAKFAEKIKKVPGAADLRVQRVLGLPLIEIKADRQKMARYGVEAEEILTTVEALRIGRTAGKVFEGFKRFDLVVRLQLDVSDLSEVENIPVMTSGGITIPLGQVATIQFEEGPAAIYREALKRRIMVEANVRGRDLVGFVNEAQKATAELEQTLPDGYRTDWGGQFENFTRAKNRLLFVVPIALAIIFFMLMAAFGNVYYALGVFIVVPLAISGGIIGLVVRGLPFSIPAGVGFIAVSGIAVLNGVVYASTLREELAKGLRIGVAVITAGVNSLRPVMTTEIIAAVGFLPMAMSTMAGAEVQRPLATVVIFGIIVATVLSRVLLPIVMEYLLNVYQHREERKALDKKRLEAEFQKTHHKNHVSIPIEPHSWENHSEIDNSDEEEQPPKKTKKSSKTKNN